MSTPALERKVPRMQLPTALNRSKIGHAKSRHHRTMTQLRDRRILQRSRAVSETENIAEEGRDTSTDSLLSAVQHFSSCDCISSQENMNERDSTSGHASRDQSSLPRWLKHLLKGSPYDSSIAALAIPAVLALAADPLLQVVDTVFVGQAGADSLAALGVNSALFTFSFVIFNFLATATTPLVATAISGGDGEKAGHVTSQALILATVLGCGLAIALHVFADPALELMGADQSSSPEMFALAKDFLLIRAMAAPAALIITVGQGVFRGLQDMKTPLNVTLLANGVNLTLDILLILGLGLGVKGAASATVVAEWTAAAAFLGLIWKRQDVLGGFSALRSGIGASSVAEAARDALPFLSAGGAVLLRTAALLGTKTLASATAARLGPVSIASHQIVMQLWLLSSFAIDSLAVAGQSLVAVELGGHHPQHARDVSDRLLQLGLGVGVVLAVGFGLASPIIPKIFHADGDVESSVLQILPLAIGLLPMNAIVYVLDGILVGASDFQWMAMAMLGSAIGAGALLFAVEPLHAGIMGIWMALAVLMTGRLGTLLWRYHSRNGPFTMREHGSSGENGISET